MPLVASGEGDAEVDKHRVPYIPAHLHSPFVFGS